MYKKNKKAFTILELVVIIALISLIALWMSKINFNRLSNEQESEILANKIISIIEEARDNSITWKGVYENKNFIEVNNRNIEIKLWENFEIISKANSKQISKIKKIKKQRINKIQCWDNDFDGNPIITFEQGKIIFNNNCKKNLKIFIDYNWANNEIEIDRISWLIKKCKNKCK